MYKLTILFFFLTAFNSQSLTDSYQLKFANENATYTLLIKEGNLVMENQPDVTVIEKSNPSDDTDKKTNKIYKITKGATFEEGLKIGGIDIDDVTRIGEIDIDDVDGKIGEIIIDDVDGKIGGIDIEDVDRIKENTLFETEDYDAYEIKLGYELVMILEQSTNALQKIDIPENGFYIYIVGNELILFE